MSTQPVITERKKPGRKPWKNITPVDLAANPLYQLDAESGSVTVIGPTLAQFLATPPVKQRLRYREQLTLPQALEELAKLRAISQLASEEINQRAQPVEDSCMMCGKILPIGFKAIQMVVVRDLATGTAQTKVLCSIECVRQHNKSRMQLQGDEHRNIVGDIK